MNDRRLTNRIFTVALLAVGGWAALTSLSWRLEVRLAPLTTALLIATFTLFQLVRAEVLVPRRSARQPSSDEPPPAALVAPHLVEAATAATHTAEQAAEDSGLPRPTPRQLDDPGILGPWKGVVWLVAALAMLVLFGVLIGLPLAIFLLCRFAFQARWVVCVVLVAAVGAILWIFDTMFQVFWPVGWLFG